MTERIKPFLAYMNPSGILNVSERSPGSNAYSTKVRHESLYSTYAPVVVTPLLPDDPKIGDTGWTDYGRPVSILGPVYVGLGNKAVVRVQQEGYAPAVVIANQLVRTPTDDTPRGVGQRPLLPRLAEDAAGDT